MLTQLNLDHEDIDELCVAMKNVIIKRYIEHRDTTTGPAVDTRLYVVTALVKCMIGLLLGIYSTLNPLSGPMRRQEMGNELFQKFAQILDEFLAAVYSVQTDTKPAGQPGSQPTD